MTDLERAKEIAATREWEGDPRVNFILCYKAARVLAKRVEELETALSAALEDQQKMKDSIQAFREGRTTNVEDIIEQLPNS